jgi:hypothetical protein
MPIKSRKLGKPESLQNEEFIKEDVSIQPSNFRFFEIWLKKSPKKLYSEG